MIDFALFRHAVREQLRVRKLVATILLVALPGILAFIWRSTAGGRFRPEIAYDTLAVLLVFGFTLVILAVIYATGTVSQELEDRTIVYLLTRPVPRWRILLAKFLAALAVIVATCWLSATALALVAYGPSEVWKSHLRTDLQILPVGAFAYGTVFLLLATFTKRPLIFGLLYAFGWESWVPNLSGNFQKLSLMAYLRVLAPHPAQQESGGNELTRLFQLLNPASITTTIAWIVLGCVTFAALAGALVIFSEREYAPKEDAE